MVLYLVVCYGVATDTRARSPSCVCSQGRDYVSPCSAVFSGVLLAPRYGAFPSQLSERWTFIPALGVRRDLSVRSHKYLPKIYSVVFLHVRKVGLGIPAKLNIYLITRARAHARTFRFSFIGQVCEQTRNLSSVPLLSMYNTQHLTYS